MPLYKVILAWHYKSEGVYESSTMDAAIKVARGLSMPRLPRDKSVQFSDTRYFVKEAKEIKEVLPDGHKRLRRESRSSCSVS
jgi:hypothetical protein